MPTTIAQRLIELRQYVEDLEVGLALSLDDLKGQLEGIEKALDAIQGHLGMESRSEPGATGPLDTNQEGG